MQQAFDVLPEPLVEHPQHDPDARVPALRAERGVDVVLVGAVHQRYAPRGLDLGRPQRLRRDRPELQDGRHPGQLRDLRRVVPRQVRQHGDHRDFVLLDQLLDQPVRQRIAAADDVMARVLADRRVHERIDREGPPPFLSHTAGVY